MPELIVHWLTESRAHAIIWLLEELQVPYSIKRYSRVPTFAPEELKKIHPLGKSPVLEIKEDGKSLVLPETAAIIEYITNRFGKSKVALPETAPEEDKLKEIYWRYFPESSAVLPAFLVFAALHAHTKFPGFAQGIAKRVQEHLFGKKLDNGVKPFMDLTESSLSEDGFFFGKELNVADFSSLNLLVTFILIIESKKDDESYKYPKIQKWFAEVRKRPAYQKAVQETDEGLATFAKNKFGLVV